MADEKRPAQKPAATTPTEKQASKPAADTALPALHDDHRRALVEGRHPHSMLLPISIGILGEAKPPFRRKTGLTEGPLSVVVAAFGW